MFHNTIIRVDQCQDFGLDQCYNIRRSRFDKIKKRNRLLKMIFNITDVTEFMICTKRDLVIRLLKVRDDKIICWCWFDNWLKVASKKNINYKEV